MSTCPSKEIHSLYIDDELLQPYKNSFEVHLSQCAECTKQQQLYRSINHDLQDFAFEQDHESGYVCLKSRLRYKKVVNPEKLFSLSAYALKIAPLMAAALILALFLPLNLFYNNAEQNSILASTSDTLFLTDFASPYNSIQASPIQQQGILVNGNMPQIKLASMMGTSYTIGLDAPKLTETDVFMPDLPKNTVQIQITLFHVSDMPLDGNSDRDFSKPVALIAELNP